MKRQCVKFHCYLNENDIFYSKTFLNKTSYDDCKKNDFIYAEENYCLVVKRLARLHESLSDAVDDVNKCFSVQVSIWILNAYNFIYSLIRLFGSR